MATHKEDRNQEITVFGSQQEWCIYLWCGIVGRASRYWELRFPRYQQRVYSGAVKRLGQATEMPAKCLSIWTSSQFQTEEFSTPLASVGLHDPKMNNSLFAVHLIILVTRYGDQLRWCRQCDTFQNASASYIAEKEMRRFYRWSSHRSYLDTGASVSAISLTFRKWLGRKVMFICDHNPQLRSSDENIVR